MPSAEALASCEDVLDRLVPCIRAILEYLRSQGRHPDTSLLAPAELLRATGRYFTDADVERLVQAFNGAKIAAAAIAAAAESAGALPPGSTSPLLPTRALLAVLRKRANSASASVGASGGARRKPIKRTEQAGGASESSASMPPLEHAVSTLDAAVRSGQSAEVVRSHRIEVVELFNQRAVQLLATGDLSGCFRLLDAAQRHLEADSGEGGGEGGDAGRDAGGGFESTDRLDARLSPLAAVTANNLACFYRRKGLLQQALTQLLRAAAIEVRLKSPRGPADTQINLCVVYSELNRHEEGESACGAPSNPRSHLDSEPQTRTLLVGPFSNPRLPALTLTLHPHSLTLTSVSMGRVSPPQPPSTRVRRYDSSRLRLGTRAASCRSIARPCTPQRSITSRLNMAFLGGMPMRSVLGGRRYALHALGSPVSA